MFKTLSLVLLFSLFFCSQNLSAQAWKWARGSNCPRGLIESWPVAVDASGNTYMAGTNMPSWTLPYDSLKSYFGTDSVRGSGLVIASADSNGTYRWAIGAKDAGVWNLSADAAGNVYVFGYFSNHYFTLGTHTISSGGFDNAGFCAKLDAAGNVIWLKMIADSSMCTGIVGPSGDIYMAGQFSAAHLTFGTTTLTNSLVGTYDIFVAKLDTAGNVIWAGSFGGDSVESIASSSLAVTPTGDAYLMGTYKSPTMTIGTTTLINPTSGTIPYGFVTKYNSSGTPLWAKSIAFSEPIYPQLNGIGTDYSGNVYLTGGFNGTITFGTYTLTSAISSKMFLARYDVNGIFRWANTNNSSAYSVGYSVAPDVCGNVWACGYAIDVMGSDPLKIARYDSSGAISDSIYISSGGDDLANLLVDNRGNLYVCGDYYMDSFVVGHDTLRLTDSTLETLFIARYTYPICSIPALEVKAEVEPLAGIFLYPNPASNELLIHSGSGVSIIEAEISDIAGRQIAKYKLTGNQPSIDVSNLPPGVYLCKMYTAENSIIVRKFIVTK